MPIATLHVETGPAAGSVIEVENEPLLIGRATGPGHVDPLGADTELSREHARIFLEDGTPTIVDIGSTNGTFVNGRRLDAPTELRPGDRIKVGATILRLRPWPGGRGDGRVDEAR